ncbi:TonB-dependent receptor plug domain-containing protein [Sphingomonas morindae]|uniref:TonB-dependent receptor n=1 Tax=Sphingomonas morindae TaxID=1541170 RepID=A0ABY4X653_9SPHN|nr:TonB-dependent receptor plug domain-containing protein [Sphingomonas morindae]USI72332.1 TonB-dependent receptor [Sphingomonas morindae]
MTSSCLTAALVALAAGRAEAAEVPGQDKAATAETDTQRTADPGAIVVTGTRIQRLNYKAAAPILSVSARDIAAQAPVNIEEVLNRLPQIAPDSQQNYQDSDGRQRIKLRNLGFERTLTLVDGKRLGTMNGADANMIPVALVQRVDVLTGGASAVYGSDAVAGVVNFILKHDFEGVQLNANYGFYNHNNRETVTTRAARDYGFPVPRGMTTDGGRGDFSLTAGHGFFNGALQLVGFVDYRWSDRVPNVARDFAACGLTDADPKDPGCSASSYSKNGTIVVQGGPAKGKTFVNNPDGSGTFVPYGTGPGLAANRYEQTELQRRDRRINAGGFATLTLSPALELYADLLWYQDRSYRVSPPVAYSYSAFDDSKDKPYVISCDNPFLTASQATTLCGADAGRADVTIPLDVKYRLALPQQEEQYTRNGFRLSAGVRGEIAQGWRYDVGTVYAYNRSTYVADSYSDPARLRRALDVVLVNGTPTCRAKRDGIDEACVPFNAFKAGNSDVAAYHYMANRMDGRFYSSTSLTDVLATLQGDLGRYGIVSPFARQSVAVALGAEFRRDTFKDWADARFRMVSGGSDRFLSQHVWEGNVEVQAPLVEDKLYVKQLRLDAGYRVSKYSGIGGGFKTWKLEAIYAPVSDISFRASINKAERAPTVIEISQAKRISYAREVMNDICAPTPALDPADKSKTIYTPPKASLEMCHAQGVPDNMYGSKDLLCPEEGCTLRYGALSVEPEDAITKSFGVVLTPSLLPGLSLSVDRWMIQINNAIGFNYGSFFMQRCLEIKSDFYCSKIVRNPDGTLSSPLTGSPSRGFVDAGTTNFYTSISRGIDFQAQLAHGIGKIGKIDVSFAGTLMTFAGGQEASTLPRSNCVGYMNCQLMPRWTHGLRTGFTTRDGHFSVSFNWRYVGSLTNSRNSGRPELGWEAGKERKTFYRIAPQNYFDLWTGVTVAKRLTLSLAINNLFDKSPPILPYAYDVGLSRSNTLPQRYDALGRNIVFSTGLKF